MDMQTIDQPDIQGAEVLGQKVMEFCHLLRANGVEVTASRIIDTFRALKAIDCFRRGDFYIVLEANLISRTTDRELFYALFQQFWHGPDGAMIPDPCLPGWEDECGLPPHSLIRHGFSSNRCVAIRRSRTRRNRGSSWPCTVQRKC